MARSEDERRRAKRLNQQAREAAFIDLSNEQAARYRTLYDQHRVRLYRQARIPLYARVLHADNGMGHCDTCGELSPCTAERRRIRDSDNGNSNPNGR